MKKKSFIINGKKYTLRLWATIVYTMLKYTLITLLAFLIWITIVLVWTDTHHELVNSYNQSVLVLGKGV